ncbi:MAG: ATP-grasp domain-containing protein [Geminicoccaceae bacterium]
MRPVIIVDGYSTGRELLNMLILLDTPCLHLRSVAEPPSVLARSFDPRGYLEDLGHLGVPVEAAATLRDRNPAAVVAGSEPGVTYAEQLADQLGLPTNDMHQAECRRDKFVMTRTIADHGLHAASQILLRDKAEAECWAGKIARWPIVLKPIDSAGSDGVTICHSYDDIGYAADRIFDKTNLLGFTNRKLVAQSFLDGQQFIVNTVSKDSLHTVTDVWYMNVRPVPGFANAMQDFVLADPNAPEIAELIAYTKKAITALGIRNGAAHSELKLTKEGPALIETGARLMGPTIEASPYLAAGLPGTQASALAHSLVAPDRLVEDYRAERCYCYRKAIAKSFFIFKGQGTVRSTKGLERLKSLPSFHSMHRPLLEGDEVRLTADTVGRGGVVYLVHDRPEQIDQDRSLIRKWDDDNQLYEVDYH